MTELLSEEKIDYPAPRLAEFTRRTFLKGGGALVVGFSVAGSLLAGRAKGATARVDGRAARRGQHRLVGRAPRGQHRDDLLREDQHHRLQHRAPADRRGRARPVDGAGQGDGRRHRVLPEPGHHGRLERDLERRPAGPPGRGRGARRAARARGDAARRQVSTQVDKGVVSVKSDPSKSVTYGPCSAASASRRRTPAGRR